MNLDSPQVAQYQRPPTANSLGDVTRRYSNTDHANAVGKTAVIATARTGCGSDPVSQQLMRLVTLSAKTHICSRGIGEASTVVNDDATQVLSAQDVVLVTRRTFQKSALTRQSCISADSSHGPNRSAMRRNPRHRHVSPPMQN